MRVKRKTDGVLHGAVSWAVTTLLFVAVCVSSEMILGIALALALGAGAIAGLAVTFSTLRLRDDYLAIVTLNVHNLHALT